MIRYTADEIKEIIERHKRWVEESDGWSEEDRADLSEADLSRANLSRANLSGADLTGANLCRANLCGAYLPRADLTGANLCRANLCGADLRGAYLPGAYLSGADLCGAYLSRADLTGANLCRANLSGADLCGANLYRANLSGADLSRADLTGANLCRANLCGADIDDETKIKLCITCPDTGSFTAWKSAGGYIVKLEIPEDAKRSSATTRKCRADKAKVLEIQNKDGSVADVAEVTSEYGGVYKPGEMIYPDKWDECRWNECSNGIHFFVTRMEAEDWG